MAYISDGSCKLVSRKDNAYKTFGNLSDALAKLKAKAILDGEIVCLDEAGSESVHAVAEQEGPGVVLCFRSVVAWRQRPAWIAPGPAEAATPNLLRKAMLPGVIYASHIEQHGIALYQEICQRDLEGIACKQKDSIYSSKSWLKVKNPDYTQAVGRWEMFERFLG